MDSVSAAPRVMSRSEGNGAGINEKSRESIMPFSGVIRMRKASSVCSVWTSKILLNAVLNERMRSRVPEMEWRTVVVDGTGRKWRRAVSS